jgi:PAS domain S-box-containing protein
MLLESAIEKRRQELMKQEERVLEKRTPSTYPPAMDPEGRDAPGIAEPGISLCTDETLEKIPQSAAIVQRGIVKQINTSFMELLGYSIDELVEKSYFDFIALEGLADVEKYYLDRLKGDGVSTYKTVFSTKDNTKIPVEVVIKQTVYNGEKAEIVIITCSESKP